MRWIRTWIAGELPTDRPYVVDDMERLPLANWDYTPLGEIDDDVIVLEWDMALDPSDATAFENWTQLAPNRPIVAPYRLHHIGPTPVWAHRVNTRDGATRWIHEYEGHCNYFGFGLVYLPRKLVKAFLQAPAPERGAPRIAPGGFTDTRFTDSTFSEWYNKTVGLMTPVIWDVRPVHLHSKIAASERL